MKKCYLYQGQILSQIDQKPLISAINRFSSLMFPLESSGLEDAQPAQTGMFADVFGIS